MSNPSRRIGTQGENRSVEVFGEFWDVDRLGGNRASHDIVGAPFPIETKRQGAIKLGDWLRKMISEHGQIWVYHLVPRDRRSGKPIPDDAFVITRDMLRELIWNQSPDSPYAPTKERPE